MDLLPPSVRIEFTSPYHRFCKANRPTLPTHLKNSERERLLGEMWKSLGKDGREAFKSGLVQQLHTRRGGTRAWQLAFDYRQETAAAAPLRPSRPAPALPAPLPNRAKAVEQLGNSEEELDKMLQEQLARIRSGNFVYNVNFLLGQRPSLSSRKAITKGGAPTRMPPLLFTSPREPNPEHHSLELTHACAVAACSMPNPRS